jgi:hypothetical protein
VLDLIFEAISFSFEEKRGVRYWWKAVPYRCAFIGVRKGEPIASVSSGRPSFIPLIIIIILNLVDKKLKLKGDKSCCVNHLKDLFQNTNGCII